MVLGIFWFVLKFPSLHCLFFEHVSSPPPPCVRSSLPSWWSLSVSCFKREELRSSREALCAWAWFLPGGSWSIWRTGARCFVAEPPSVLRIRRSFGLGLFVFWKGRFQGCRRECLHLEVNVEQRCRVNHIWVLHFNWNTSFHLCLGFWLESRFQFTSPES